MAESNAIILLPHLQVQNCNAISSPITWGFPAVTSFTGFAHALERKSPNKFKVKGVGIICHSFEPQVSGKWNKTFCLTRNPIKKNGGPPSMVEEGRVHIKVSLALAVRAKDYMTENEGANFAEDIMTIANGMRIAGGSILPMRSGKRYQGGYWLLPDDMEGRLELFKEFRKRCLPGFALVRRDDLLNARLSKMREEDSTTNSLDALMDITRLNWEPEQNPEKPDETNWSVRSNPGWLVPIPVGYAAISPLYKPGEVVNARDGETPFQFVEAIYTVGQWVSPHRVKNLEQLLWHHHADKEKGLYQCENCFSEKVNN